MDDGNEGSGLNQSLILEILVEIEKKSRRVVTTLFLSMR